MPDWEAKIDVTAFWVRFTPGKGRLDPRTRLIDRSAKTQRLERSRQMSNGGADRAHADDHVLEFSAIS